MKTWHQSSGLHITNGDTNSSAHTYYKLMKLDERVEKSEAERGEELAK